MTEKGRYTMKNRKKLMTLLLAVVMLISAAPCASALVTEQIGYKRQYELSEDPVNFALTAHITYLPGTSTFDIRTMRNTVSNYSTKALTSAVFRASGGTYSHYTDVHLPPSIRLAEIPAGAVGQSTEVDWQVFTQYLGETNVYPISPYVYTMNGVMSQATNENNDWYYFFETYWNSSGGTTTYRIG